MCRSLKAQSRKENSKQSRMLTSKCEKCKAIDKEWSRRIKCDDESVQFVSICMAQMWHWWCHDIALNGIVRLFSLLFSLQNDTKYIWSFHYRRPLEMFAFLFGSAPHLLHFIYFRRYFKFFFLDFFVLSFVIISEHVYLLAMQKPTQ